MSELGYPVSDRRQHASQYLQAQILLVAQAIGTALEHANLVVESLDETQGHLVLRPAKGSNARPVLLDHAGELLVRFEPLPFEGGFPVLEEAQRPAFPLVTPELAEGLLEQVSHMQTPVGLQQFLECAPAFQIQILAVGQQRVFLPLDETTFGPRQSGIFALAHLVERLAQMAHDMKLVEQDGGIGNVAGGRVAERFPHVHHRQTNLAAFLWPQPAVKLVHAGFRAVVAPEPDGATAQQIADHDPVSMPLANRHLVDANDQRTGSSHPPDLLPHVLLVQLLDRLPIQTQFLCHRLDCRVATPPPHVKGEPFGVKRIVRQPSQSFPLHLAALLTVHTPDFQFQIDAQRAARQIPNRPGPPVVKTAAHGATLTTHRFFWRRRKTTSRTQGSPKTPCTSVSGTKPGNRYASRNCRLVLRTHTLQHVFELQKSEKLPVNTASNPLPLCKITHSPRRRPLFILHAPATMSSALCQLLRCDPNALLPRVKRFARFLGLTL